MVRWSERGRYGNLGLGAADDCKMVTYLQALATIAALNALGLLGFGFLSSRGNIWERLAIVSAFGMSGSFVAAYGLALVYYVKLRLELLPRFRVRVPLTDEEFIALSPALKGAHSAIVNLVRPEVAKEFRSIGGERFHPGDDLENDLHLSDVTLWGDWLYIMAADLGIDQDEFKRGLGTAPIRTYGDLILLFDRLWRQSACAKTPPALHPRASCLGPHARRVESEKR